MKLVLALGFCLITTVAAARPLVIVVMGSGTATEPDRGSADSEALDQAQSNANMLCTGTVISTAKVSDTCLTIGDQDTSQYVCNVMVRAQCQL